MRKPLVSIIIPIYNGEIFIDTLYCTLNNQTYENFEVILVDDISADASISMLNKISEKDKRFRPVVRETKGGCAIQGVVYGLPYCNGEYYFYMSQDDFIDQDCLEKCVQKAITSAADVVVPNSVFYYENKKSKKITRYPLFNNYNSTINPKTAFLRSLKWHFPGIALRKMDLVRKTGYRADYFNDDEFYNRKSYLLADKITFANTNFYYRMDNQDAITKSIKYFTFDILTTDILLAKCLLEYNYSNRIIDKRFKELLCAYSNWINIYKEHKHKFNEEQNLYVINTLKNAKTELETVVKERNLLFSKLYLKFNKLEEAE